MTLGTRLLDREESLLHPHLPVAVAGDNVRRQPLSPFDVYQVSLSFLIH
jgi:hypothetical protein